MGDFNIDLLKVNLDAKTNEFVNDVISQGFLPTITRPTRITPHSATLIDHIGLYSNDNRPTSQNDLELLLLMWLITLEHSILLASANKHPYKHSLLANKAD